MIRKVLKLTILICFLLTEVSFAQIGKCKGKYFGNIIAYSTPSNYGTYWNQVTSENGSKWGSIEGAKGSYNFSNSDLAYNWAKNNKGLFKFHALVWGAQTPGYVSTASTETITSGVHDFIKACSTHYVPMGGVTLIDVLNEPVNTPMPGNMKAALTAGYQAEPANAADKNNQYGWAIWCFQLARKYFPNATLLINEYNIEMNWGNCRARYIPMINAIKNAPNLTDGKKNLIDGVGLQCHGINDLSAANFKACIDEIWNKTGLPIHITEFDATADPNEAKQQAVYSSLIPVAWEHPHVAGITLWGYIQGSTWVGGNKVAGPNGTDTGLLYSSSYSAKPLGERPAMTWLKQYMASQPTLACCPAPAPFANCTNASKPPVVSLTAPAGNSSYTTLQTITLTASASDPDGTVANVEFYDGNTLLFTDNSAPYSYTWSGASPGTHSITAKATDNAGVSTVSSAVTITVTAEQAPFKGTAHLVPGRIQAEEYDLGGEGVAYHEVNTNGNEGKAELRNDQVDIETTGDNSGTYNVGYILKGEWLEYTLNVAATAPYSFDLRVAANGDGRVMHVEIDGTDVTGQIAVPNTGGWQTWSTVSAKDINLTQGKHIMRLVFDSDYMNINYVEFGSVITGVAESNAAELRLSPNPFAADGIVIKNAGSFNYRITDISGQVAEHGAGAEGHIAGRNLTPGVYLLFIDQESGSSIHKIIRQ
jgi:GH35 family endo-1,4-beta-xylanase